MLQKKLPTSIVVSAGLLLAVSTPAWAMTYYVRPDGNNANPGTRDTQNGAWRSIDRGQPTVLAKPAATGDTILHLAKASQFPPQGKVNLGKTAVSYTGRTLQGLTGCTGVADAKAGTPVTCPDWPPPQPGDTVIVARGVYSLAFEAELLAVPNFPMAVAVIRSGGTADKPIVFKGKELPVVDGRDDTIGWAVNAPYIQIEGFDIRRGGVWVFRGKGSSLRNCRIHEGNRAVSFAYSNECEISGNLIYDFQGAWTNHGITVGFSENVKVRNNTIVSCSYAVRLYGGRHNEINHNLIAWCRLGIRFDAKKPPEDCRVHDNNIWWCRGGIWLQRDDNRGKNFYEHVSPDPKDRHQEPMIVGWRPNAEDFLRVHRSSPLVKDGRAWIGARRQPADYPEADNRPGENLVFNPSFEAGFLGWHLSSWEGFLPGQAGYEIVEVPAAEQQKCLHVYDLPPTGRRINVRARSLNFRYTRGRPLTISFRAKADTEGALLGVGLNVPSWQDKSEIGTKVALTTEWKTYTHTLTPPARFPDVAAVSLTTVKGHYWIDAVKVEEGARATSFSPAMEFVPDEYLGMLVPPNQPLRARIINRTGGPISGTLKWSLQTPFRQQVATGSQRLNVAGDTTSCSFSLPAKLSGGIFVLHYTFSDSQQRSVARGKLRFSIGTPPAIGRNHHFFAATPDYSGDWPGKLFERKVQVLAALGLGTLHTYVGYRRINEMLSNERFSGLLESTEKAGLAWLVTPSDAAALTGKQTWAPGPGNVGPEAIEIKREDLGSGRCTDAQLQAWCDAIGMLARRFRGRIKFWEILNEPNTFLNGEEYGKVLAATSRTLRGADPDAHIIAGSVVNAHRKDLYQTTISAPAGSFDSFSFHPYRFGLPNPESERESYRRMIQEVKADLSQAGHSPTIFLTEEGMGPGLDETRCIGYRLGHNGIVRQVDWGEGEILQAQYGARMYLTALGEGCIGYSYHTLGGLTHDSLMNPLLALKTLHTMDSVLGDAVPAGKVDVGHDFVCYLFQIATKHPAAANGRSVVAGLWPKDAEYAQPIPITFRGRITVSAVDLFGMPLEITRQGEENPSVMLGRALVYLTFEETSVDDAKRLLARSFTGVHGNPKEGAPRASDPNM